MSFRNRAKAYLTVELQQLMGGTVIAAGPVEDEDGYLWPRLMIRTPKGLKRVEVSRDPEGNGPGHLFIDDAVRKESCEEG